ncbi:MAG: hypothetical protein SNG38_06265 [Rikenellaceae bacterium]
MIPKHIYIIIAGLLAFGFVPTYKLRINNIFTFLSLAWSFGGLFLYSKMAVNRLNSFKNKQWVFWILILIVFSSFTPVEVYNQSLVGSFVALRTIPTIIYLNVFLMMQPDEDDFYTAFKFLGVLACALMLYSTYFDPYLYIEAETAERRLSSILSGETTDIIFGKPGWVAVVFLFFMSFDRVVTGRASVVDGGLFLLSLAFIFVIQNRSTLLIIIPMLLYMLYKAKFRFKTTIVVFLVVVVGTYVSFILETLIEETKSQFLDPDYARWRAFDYYIRNWDYNFYTFLFGNGFTCKDSKFLTLIDLAKENGLYASDLGMFGAFFHFGSVLIIILYNFVLKGLKRFNPVYLRFYAAWILLVPTIHIIHWNVATQLKFSIFIYLVIYYRYKNRTAKLHLKHM